MIKTMPQGVLLCLAQFLWIAILVLPVGAQTGREYGPKLIVQNDTHHEISVKVYDRHQHLLETFSVKAHQTRGIVKSQGNVWFQGDMLVEINGERAELKTIGQQSDRDWVVHYDGHEH